MSTFPDGGYSVDDLEFLTFSAAPVIDIFTTSTLQLPDYLAPVKKLFNLERANTLPPPRPGFDMALEVIPPDALPKTPLKQRIICEYSFKCCFLFLQVIDYLELIFCITETPQKFPNLYADEGVNGNSVLVFVFFSIPMFVEPEFLLREIFTEGELTDGKAEEDKEVLGMDC